jgi:hypothetical protein
MDKVADEIIEAESAWGSDYASGHEALGVLLEEVEEFKVEVFKSQRLRTRAGCMHAELLQVAACAIRYAAQIERANFEVMR